MELAGMPMLAVIVRRLSSSRKVDQLVVATTCSRPDDAVAALSRELGTACFRGSEEDCLDRYYGAARQFTAEVVVRLTGDNPLVDGTFVDLVVQDYLAADPPVDYQASTRTFPLGLATEVLSFDALESAWREDTNPHWREHVTPFIRNHPERFGLGWLFSPRDLSHMRWTVDTSEDLEFIRQVFDHIGHHGFPWQEAVALLDQHPEWMEINRNVEQKRVGE